MNKSTIIRCNKGLAKTCIQELKAKNLILRNERPTIVFQKNDDLIFLAKGFLKEHEKSLRIPEEIYDCLAYGKFKISKKQISKIVKSLKKNQKYKIVAMVEGTHFFKKSLRNWLEKELKAEGALFSGDGKEIWAFCIDSSYYIGLENFHHRQVSNRKNRTQERVGSLPSTIASAMCFVANPKDGEIIWDPTCGSGTILAEIGETKKNLKLFGSDIDKRAVAIAKANLRFLKNTEIKQEDSTKTKLENDSIDVIIANLPFRKQFGNLENNEKLYCDLFQEFIRVGSKKCRIVLITSDIDAVNVSLEKNKKLKLIKAIGTKIKGESAKILEIWM